MNDFYILTHGEDFISSKKVNELTEAVKGYYHFSTPNFWMRKMFQFGFAYGKHVDRVRRKKGGARHA